MMKKIVTYYFLTASLIILSFISMPYAQGKGQHVYRKTVTIGFIKNIFTDVDINDAHAAIKVWVHEIAKTNDYQNDYNTRAKIYGSIDEVSKEMKTDSLATLSLTTLDYLDYGSKLGLEPALVPVVNNEIGSKYYFLVKKSSNINSIKNLENTILGITHEPAHVASRIWLDVTLAKNNLPSKEKYFKKIVVVEKQSQLIMDLFFGQIDVATVSDHDFHLMKELNPQIGKDLKIILTSPKYLWGLTCFTNLYNEKEKKLFFNSAINIQDLITGKQLCSLIKIDKLIPFKKEFINNYITLLKEYENLIKKGKITKNEYY